MPCGSWALGACGPCRERGLLHDRGPGVRPGTAVRGPVHHPGVLFHRWNPCPEGEPHTVRGCPPYCAWAPGRGLPGWKQRPHPHRRPMGSRVLLIPIKPGQVADCPGLGFLSGGMRPFVAFPDQGSVCGWRVQQSHRHRLRSHLLRPTSIPWTRDKGQGSTKRGWLLN